MKKIYTKDIKNGEVIKSSFMIMKKLYKDGNKVMAYIGDKTGDIKAAIHCDFDSIKVGEVIDIEANAGNVLDVTEFKKITNYKEEDYLPSVKVPIEEIMKEIEDISKVEFKSEECLALNDYFFKNEEFVDKFKKGIGGVSQHHNYRGGLAEHTLNVMYMAKIMAYRYECRNKDIAILAAKLHDMGKIYEYNVDGPFSFTMRGEMEGHVVVGAEMLEEAFKANPEIYSEDFKMRVKGCIVQHHGKLEYGSPKQPNMEESYIVHYADYIDATFNKISQIKEGGTAGTWSDYDKRIDGKLYL